MSNEQNKTNSKPVRAPGGRGGQRGANVRDLDFGLLKKLFRFLMKDYRTVIIIIAVCIAVSAAAGVVPAVVIKNITGYMTQGLGIFTENIPAGVALNELDADTVKNIGAVVWSQLKPQIANLILATGSILLLGLAATAAREQLVAYMTQGFLDKMRRRLFDKMQDLPVKYFDQNTHGDIMSIYTNDIDTLRQLISQGIPAIFSASITLMVLVFIMMYFSIDLMVVVVLGVIGMFFVTKKVGGNSAKYFMKQQKSVGKMEGFIEEMMNGQKVVKVFTHEEAAKKDFDKVNDELRENSRRANTFSNIFGPIMNNIGNILYVLTAFVGGVLIIYGAHIPNLSLENIFSGNLSAPLTVAVVASYLGMCKQFTGQVNQASQQINAIAMGMAGAARIFELLESDSEADEGYVTLVNCKEENGVITECAEHTGKWAWRHPHSADGSVTYTLLRGDVVLDHVDFSYEEDKQILYDVSLYAKPGQKVAFVGATGAGKTTITNLLNRFYDIEDGKIRYDGININKIKKADLRRSLGIVLQSTNLFTGTVMDNIRYGRLDATDEECISAARLANAHDFITRLPDGYNTMLTSNGANLSQGQRQLLSIARAAVANPPVMILDEATSSIDTRTEALVQQGMDALMKGRTVFVIAHRLSTVQNSNAIMVLDHGRIIERGSHDDLIAQKGTYHALYTGAFELE